MSWKNVSRGFRISVPVALVAAFFVIGPNYLKTAVATEGAPQGAPQESDECRELRERCQAWRELVSSTRRAANEACETYDSICTFSGGGLSGWFLGLRSACRALRRDCQNLTAQADEYDAEAQRACDEYNRRCP